MNVKTHKSAGVSFALTFFFNFFGLLYNGFIPFLVIGAIYVAGVVGIGNIGDDMPEPQSTAEAVGAGLASFVVYFIWHGITGLLSIIVGIVLTQRHNKKVDSEKALADEARHQETLAALNREKE